MDYSQFAVDLGKRIAGVLENDVDFMAIQKGLTGVVNIPMQGYKVIHSGKSSTGFHWCDCKFTSSNVEC